MKIKASSIFLLTSIFLTGCSTYSSNIRVGNDQSYINIDERRNAVRTVRVYDSKPENAISLGSVSAGRCHRNFVESAPEENIVLTDLKIAAYAQGADGITNIEIEKTSGLARNCWYILDAEAEAFIIDTAEES